MQVSHCLAVLSLCVAVGCAQEPGPPRAGRATLHGTLKLVPHDGVEPQAPGSVHYGSRRLRDVEFVDYSKPGFAVVYLDAPGSVGGRRELTVRESRGQVRLEPRHAVVGMHGEIVVTNAGETRHVVSCPASGLLQWLAPGESLSIAAAEAGPHDVFLLDVAEVHSLVFVAPGPYVVVAADGRWALRDVAPGARRLRAWHPRLPPTEQSVHLAPGATARVDIEVGVGSLRGEHGDH